MEPIMKHCWKCHTDKPIDKFCRKGKDSVCQPCRYDLNSEWAKNNREKLRPKRAEYMRNYRARKDKEEAAKLVPADPPKEPDPK